MSLQSPNFYPFPYLNSTWKSLLFVSSVHLFSSSLFWNFLMSRFPFWKWGGEHTISPISIYYNQNINIISVVPFTNVNSDMIFNHLQFNLTSSSKVLIIPMPCFLLSNLSILLIKKIFLKKGVIQGFFQILYLQTLVLSMSCFIFFPIIPFLEK